MKEYVEIMNNFNKIIKNEKTINLARENNTDFTRKSKLGFETLVKMILSRTGKTVSNEVINYYCEIDRLDSSVSKQSVFQAREKLKPNIFCYLNKELIKKYYDSNIERKAYKNYTVLAIDGVVLEMPLTDETKEKFGVNNHAKNMTKTSPRCSGLYDVLNDVYLDFLINHWEVSELPMAYEQIKATKDILKDKKCIFLADRNYGATDLFLYLEKLDYKFCFRGKKNFYKKYLDINSNDSIVHIPLDEKWINRLKIEEVKDMAREEGNLVLRVIRFNKSDITNKKGDDDQVILFTNLSIDEFTREEIIKLYGKRWRIETGYGILKTKMELERVTSEKTNIMLQDVYSQIIVYNQMSILKNIANKRINNTDKYLYQININNLITLFRKLLPKILNNIGKLIKIISMIINKIIKNKEPIRENRLYPRWNTYISKPVTLKFRVDGKRNPKVQKTQKGYLRIAY